MKQIMSKPKQFVTTKQVSRSGTNPIAYIPKEWDFKKGDWVDFVIRKADGSGVPTRVTKRVTGIGTGVGLFIPKHWGFKVGDWVVFSLEKRGPIGCNSDEEPADDQESKPEPVADVNGINLPKNPAIDSVFGDGDDFL